MKKANDSNLVKIVQCELLGNDFFNPGEWADQDSVKKLDSVKKIISDVRARGDQAVRKYADSFDNIGGLPFELSRKEIAQAYKSVSRDFISSIEYAAGNIRKFSKLQMRQLKDFTVRIAGNKIGQRVIPLSVVGCYVPGGSYPLPSSALMSIIPAKVAGVRNILAFSPRIKPETIVAADIAGASRIFRVGGVQAIAAMAYGTESIPQVDKIVGPGNKFVTYAKKLVYGKTGIDFLAGPSEVLIIADSSADPSLVAADLLAQAEHDTVAKPMLVTTSPQLAKAVQKQLRIRLQNLKTGGIAAKALGNGMIIIVKSLSEAVDLSNRKAPEHLQLMVEDPESLIPCLTSYGSLFIGKYSGVAFGDYCSGTNHILPTGGCARYAGGLSVRDFVKILTTQEISPSGAKRLARICSVLAKAEGLFAHAWSAEKRG